MNAEWRTSTVVALCRRMLDSRTYDALPILADALQDAGCTDEVILSACRETALTYVMAERLVNLIYSPETAAAVRWLEQFVRRINYVDYKDDNDTVGTPSDTEPHTYESVIETGHMGLEDGMMGFATDEGADFFRESEENQREFFRHWSLVTGIAVSDEALKEIDFHCAC